MITSLEASALSDLSGFQSVRRPSGQVDDIHNEFVPGWLREQEGFTVTCTETNWVLPFVAGG